MRYTLSLTRTLHETLRGALFAIPDCEGAAYVRCGLSVTEGEVRLLGREVVPVQEHHYLVRERDRLSVASPSYASVAKQARLNRECVLFAHSHPTGFPEFSAQDDREEPSLMSFFGDQVPGVPHGSLLLFPPDGVRARVWTAGGWAPIDRIRIIGPRFAFHGVRIDEAPLPVFFDRQVRAFGPQLQRVLRTLHVGVVGAGGTGSAVIEQLVRLGVGTLSVFDGQTFDPTNVNRVYGSGVADEGHEKADIAAGLASRIGLGTVLHTHTKPITDEHTARLLRDCDVVFGCTDTHSPRGILVRLALRYLVPVFDLGVRIDSSDGIIRGVHGRVTTLLPGEACLFCRDRISPEMIRLEALSPQERRALADERYAPELEDPAPAVIPFTTAVAAQAVTEFLHRLTGFMGAERRSSETLLFFHESAVRTNRRPPRGDCLCSRAEHWGRGDTRDFLGLLWPTA